MLGFCTQMAFPDFRGRSEVCSREPVPVAPHPMATPQVLGRSGQAQSWRKTVGCRRPARRVSRGWCGRSQSSSRKVLAGSWPSPTPPRCPARPFPDGCSLRPPWTVRSSSVTSAPAPAGHLSHVSAWVRLSLAAHRPCTPGMSDCTLPVTLPLVGAQQTPREAEAA